jgi:hypothetical protein
MSEIIKVNFVQGRDYMQDILVHVAEAENAAAKAAISETNAASSANQAEQSAQNAAESANQAAQSADIAAESEERAVNAASQAQVYANNAQASATDAANSAQTASSQAAHVGILVTQAENTVAALDAYEVPTWDSSTVYSYPAVVAYTDGNTYRCIGTNVPAGETPNTSQNWVRISVLGGDDYFDVDMQGSLMPAVNPTFAYSWQLDKQGNIMPRAASDTLGTEINTFAETALKTAQETLTTANEALARANTIIYEGIPVELDSAGNVTTTEDSL